MKRRLTTPKRNDRCNTNLSNEPVGKSWHKCINTLCCTFVVRHSQYANARWCKTTCVYRWDMSNDLDKSISKNFMTVDVHRTSLLQWWTCSLDFNQAIWEHCQQSIHRWNVNKKKKKKKIFQLKRRFVFLRH